VKRPVVGAAAPDRGLDRLAAGAGMIAALALAPIGQG